MSRNLTKAEFDDIMTDFNWTDDSKLLAEKVLVEKLSVADVAKHFGKSRQRVNILAKQAWAAYIEKTRIPPNWEMVTVPLPKNEAKKIRELSAKLREEALILAILKKKK